MSVTHLHDRFHEAVDYFYKNNYHLAGQVCKLGYPKIVTGYPPTAGVVWNKEKNKHEFLLNEKFAESINDEELAFTMAHETAHTFNGHVFIMKSELDRMRAQSKSEEEIRRWQRRFNKAADCVVNDSLVNLYGLPRCEFPGEDGQCTIMYGKNIVGCDCHNLSVTDVMSLLPEEDEGDDVHNHDQWESFFNEDGSLDKNFVDAVKDFIDENIDNAAMSEVDMENLENLQGAMQECSDSYARQAGRSTSSNMRKISAKNASVRWEKILFRKVERNKFEDKWNRRSNKLQGFSDDLILPVNKAKEAEDIFIAIDVSGSIDWKALELFVSVVKNTPRNFKVCAITFNTMCKPFNIHSDEVRSGGGTAFNIIEDYIQENFKKYPKAVFVLTDGAGTPVSPQFPNRWTWMLYGSCYTGYCDSMSYYELESLLK